MEEPEEVVREFCQAYAARDWPRTRELQGEDARLVLPEGHPEAGEYRGWDEIVSYFRRWLGTWEHYEWTVERFVTEGDRVAVLARERGTGKGSGAETANDPGIVYTVRDGRVVCTEIYLSWDEALTALGS